MMKYTNRLSIAGLLIGFLTVLSTFALPAAVQAQEDEGSTYSIELRPPGAKADSAGVTMTFEGKLYDGDWWVSTIREEKRPLRPEEQLVLDYLVANSSGTVDEILAFWLPSERPELEPVMRDQDLFQRNRGIFQGMIDSAFIGKVFYGDYVLFFVQHNSSGIAPRINAYPFKAVGEDYFVTNELQSDPVFQYLTMAYTQTLSLKTK